MTETSPLLEPRAGAGAGAGPGAGAVTVRYRLPVYIYSVLGCLLAASFTLYSLYTEAFADRLQYTPAQINAVAIIGEVGLYVPVPLIGHLVDSYRISYVAAFGAAGYLVSYLGAAAVYTSGGSYLLMAGCFALIGVSASAVYIALLVNCGRLYPTSAFLAISVPTTAYGLSSLLLSQWVSGQAHAGLALDQIFRRMSAVLFCVGLTAALAPALARTDVLAKHAQASDEEEGDFGHVHVSHITRFARNPETWALLSTFVLCSGPLEVYLNNLGTIGARVHPVPRTATQVSIFSLFSTLSRLLVGASVDLLGPRLRPSRLLVAVLLGLAATHVLLAGHHFGGSELPFSVSSAVNGFAYGSAFTLYPILVTRVWGYDGFATYWGMFISGPAVGSLIYGIVLALDLEWCDEYAAMFALSAVGLLASVGIVWRLGERWGVN